MTTRKAEKYSYSWNCDKNRFCLNEEGATIRPFNVTIGKWSSQYKKCVNAGYEFYPHEILPIDPDVPDASTSVTAVNGVSHLPQAVYSLCGQRVGTAGCVNGRLSAEGLRPGLYIVNGRKMIVK